MVSHNSSIMQTLFSENKLINYSLKCSNLFPKKNHPNVGSHVNFDMFYLIARKNCPNIMLFAADCELFVICTRSWCKRPVSCLWTLLWYLSDRDSVWLCSCRSSRVLQNHYPPQLLFMVIIYKTIVISLNVAGSIILLQKDTSVIFVLVNIYNYRTYSY